MRELPPTELGELSPMMHVAAIRDVLEVRPEEFVAVGQQFIAAFSELPENNLRSPNLHLTRDAAEAAAITPSHVSTAQNVDSRSRACSSVLPDVVRLSRGAKRSITQYVLSERGNSDIRVRESGVPRQFARLEFSVIQFGVSSSIAVATHRDGPRPTSGAVICRSAMLLKNG